MSTLCDAAVTDRDASGYVAALVAKHGQQIRRYLNGRAQNVADVPDLCQEVYLRMLRVQDRESIRSPEAYLFAVAQNVLLRHALRHAGAPAAPLDAANFSIHDASDPVLEASAEQCLEQLQQVLDTLPPKVRTAFVLSRQDGLSVDEIAERLGTTRGMAKKYLMRALGHLRRQLERAD